MKNIFKRNQVIITALAIMIAIAGYLNYADSNAPKNSVKTDGDAEEVNVGDISDEDILAENQALEDALKSTETTTAVGETTTQSTEDIESNDLDLSSTTETTQPGEAVLVSSVGNLTFAAEARLNREQVRSKNKDTLLEIINSANATEEQKTAASDALINMTTIAEQENAAETLLEAKGFTDAVVSITDGKADVIINMSNISDAQRAQIEDTVKRKTDIDAQNIIITPVDGN